MKKEKVIVNRLNKTEKSIVIDYESDRMDRERREIEKKKAERKIQLENKKEEERQKREAAELRLGYILKELHFLKIISKIYILSTDLIHHS